MRRPPYAWMSGAVLGVLAVLSPSPALAHGAAAGGGGVRVPLLAAGAVVAAAGVALGARRGKAWAAAGLLGGAVLVGTSFVGGGGDDDRPDVHMTVVEPQQGAQVPAGTPVTVRVSIAEGALATEPGDDGGHLHLYVDRKLQQMPYSTEAQVTLTPGKHTLTVEYVDTRHVSYRPPIEQTIDVTAG